MRLFFAVVFPTQWNMLTAEVTQAIFFILWRNGFLWVVSPSLCKPRPYCPSSKLQKRSCYSFRLEVDTNGRRECQRQEAIEATLNVLLIQLGFLGVSMLRHSGMFDDTSISFSSLPKPFQNNRKKITAQPISKVCAWNNCSDRKYVRLSASYATHIQLATKGSKSWYITAIPPHNIDNGGIPALPTEYPHRFHRYDHR